MCDKQQYANRSYYANPINKWGWCFKCSFDVAIWWLTWRLAFHIKSHGFQWRSQNFSGYCFIDHTNSSGCAGCWMCKLSFFIADPYSANSKCFKPIGSFNNGNCVFRGHSSFDVQFNKHLFWPLVLDLPGFGYKGRPTLAKLVAQIVTGKYIDLGKLLAVNQVQKEPEPYLLLG